MNNAFWRTVPFLLLLGVAAALPKIVAAQDEDPPSRVARLNYMQGSISYQVSGDQDWVQADPNRPLTTGDNLWADKDSRGEVHIGSTAIRLSSETGISFLTLDDRTAQIQLAQGTIEVHLRDLTPGDDYEIDTPNLAFTLTRSGEYLVSTDPDNNTTTIALREGEGQVTGGGDSWDLQAGQQYILTGSDQLTYDAQPLPAFDDFEAWCQDRDQRENDSLSAQYVSRDVEGYSDLDGYGQWESDPDYGEVWMPTVSVGWAPYRMGHWVYIAPWGWTWIDDEPWGFAPFHYGRWAFVRSRWAWVPGPRVVRPVYAPALVGFVGGSGFGVSLAFGGGMAGVAWFPLGPRDVYVPGYRCSPRYVQNVNITNTRVVNVTEVNTAYNNVVVNRDVTRVNYTYARNDRAVTVVRRDTFVNARPVSQGMMHVNAQQIQQARLDNSGPIAPTRSSYRSPSAHVSTFRPAVPISQRAVVVRLTPAVSNPNRPGAVYTNDSRQFNQPTAPRGAAPRPQPAPTTNTNRDQQPSRDGFHPFEPPAGRNRTQAPAQQQNQRSADIPNNRVNQNQPQNENKNLRQNQNQNENQNPGNTRSQNQNENRNQPQQRQPQFRYAPPVRANDKMYDVHPPLNQRQNRTQAPARPQKSAPAPKQSNGHGGKSESQHH
ncbi:MAG TPA: DUF6600 domain-containing protein [Candidatus Dormibacteraeota bacterium]|nr:DUF6600 domain-containing protein [Candidatus Dormibacteraeota bacterium]